MSRVMNDNQAQAGKEYIQVVTGLPGVLQYLSNQKKKKKSRTTMMVVVVMTVVFVVVAETNHLTYVW